MLIGILGKSITITYANRSKTFDPGLILILSGYKKTPETESGYSFKICATQDVPEFYYQLIDISYIKNGIELLKEFGGKKLNIQNKNSKKLLLLTH